MTCMAALRLRSKCLRGAQSEEALVGEAQLNGEV
jgi:hypothetical protein